MDAFTLLKQDHKQARELFKSLMATGDRAEKSRQRMFGELKQALEVHASIEEHHFYPAVKDADETKEIVDDSLEEHSEVREMLAEMEQLSPTSKEWVEALNKLHDAVEHHVLDEEKKLFPKVQKICSKEQLDELGQKMEQEKKQLMMH